MCLLCRYASMEPVSFLSEIQAIMHACGDSKKASRDSALLIESIVHAEITRVCRQAFSLTQSEEKLLESILFLMRRDRSRLKHVLRNVSYKKLVKQVHRSISDESVEDPLISCSGLKPPLSVPFLDPIGSDTKLDFSSLLDSDVTDCVSTERYERYESLTRSMNTQQYLEFTECRAVNFIRRPQKLRDWLGLPFLTEDRGGSRLLEVLGYLCYDVVRRLVETGLECRDRERSLSRIFDFVSSPLTANDVIKPEPTGLSSRPLKRTSISEQDPFPPLVSSSLTSHIPPRHKRARPQLPLPFHPLHPPLLPSHLREGYRRLSGERPLFFLLGSGRVSSSRIRKAQRLIF